MGCQLRKEDESLFKEFLEADKDIGNLEIKQSFAEIEGEDFLGMDDFEGSMKNE